MKKSLLFSGIAALFLAGMFLIAASPAPGSSEPGCEEDTACLCTSASAVGKLKVVAASGSCYRVANCTGAVSTGAISSTPLTVGKIYKVCVKPATSPTICPYLITLEIICAEEVPNC